MARKPAPDIMPIVYTDTPESEAIGRVGYDVTTSELRIVFRDKEQYPEYIWGGVEPLMAKDFLFARSKGRWYWENLKGKKTYRIKKVVGSFRIGAVGKRISNFVKNAGKIALFRR